MEFPASLLDNTDGALPYAALGSSYGRTLQWENRRGWGHDVGTVFKMTSKVLGSQMPGTRVAGLEVTQERTALQRAGVKLITSLHVAQPGRHVTTARRLRRN